jgi:acyl-CoA synthetase (NDP forming)
MSTFTELAPLLAPKSVAIVGASDRPGNLGGVAVRLLQRFGYRGQIWPVNPNAPAVGGLLCYAGADRLPAVPDVALLALPAAAIVEAVRDCAAAGVRHGIAWAGGFTEVGGNGITLQRDLGRACAETGFRLCGPNGLGIINAPIGFAGTFSSSLAELGSLLPGSISVVSQSGGMSMQALALAHRQGVGFRYVVSCGNEVSLSAADFIRALADDEGTRVLAVYLEAVNDGMALLDALHAARRAGKSVVMLKGGVSDDSRRAALAHTGRIAGEARTFEAVLRETAVLRVTSLEELVDTCLLLHRLPPERLPFGDRVMITTFGGGAGVLAVDQCAEAHLRVPATSAELRETVAPMLTPLASSANPMDLTPQSVNDPSWLVKLPSALNTLASSSEFDAVLFLTASSSHREDELTDLIDRLAREAGKPVVLNWTLASERVLGILADRGIHAFTDSSRAIRALGHLVRHVRERQEAVASPPAAAAAFDWAAWAVVGEGSSVVTEDVVAAMLKAADLEVASGARATSAAQAGEVAKLLGLPVAMKGLSSDLPHRAVEGFVTLDVGSAGDAVRIHADFEERARVRGLSYRGTWVQAMQPKGVELLISAYRDPQFGTFVVCGMGGRLAELVRDVVVIRAPVSIDAARRRLRELRVLRAGQESGSELLLDAAARYVSRFSSWIAGAPWRVFTLELNPVIVHEDRAVAVDGLLVIDCPDGRSSNPSR